MARTPPIYRPGLNDTKEFRLPACDCPMADGRVLHYRGRSAPEDIGVGVYVTLSAWDSDDGLRVLASLDPLPHTQVRRAKQRYLHLSISRADRYPGWDEQLQIVAAIAGPPGSHVDMAMIRPRAADYINRHAYTFHWWELPVEWGLW